MLGLALTMTCSLTLPPWPEETTITDAILESRILQILLGPDSGYDPRVRPPGKDYRSMHMMKQTVMMKNLQLAPPPLE